MLLYELDEQVLVEIINDATDENLVSEVMRLVDEFEVLLSTDEQAEVAVLDDYDVSDIELVEVDERVEIDVIMLEIDELEFVDIDDDDEVEMEFLVFDENERTDDEIDDEMVLGIIIK